MGWVGMTHPVFTRYMDLVDWAKQVVDQWTGQDERKNLNSWLYLWAMSILFGPNGLLKVYFNCISFPIFLRKDSNYFLKEKKKNSKLISIFYRQNLIIFFFIKFLNSFFLFLSFKCPTFFFKKKNQSY